MPPVPADPARRRLLRLLALSPALGVPALIASPSAGAATTEKGQVIDLKVGHALDRLHRTVAGARDLTERSKGFLLIPGVTRAGLLIGGAYGEGALRINEMTVGYYSMASASFGLQAGVQTYDLALFFMTTSALERFRRAEGWELGADALVTTPEAGLSAALSTTTSQAPVIAVVFGQEGLMAGVSLAGSKYSRITR